MVNVYKQKNNGLYLFELNLSYNEWWHRQRFQQLHGSLAELNGNLSNHSSRFILTENLRSIIFQQWNNMNNIE